MSDESPNPRFPPYTYVPGHRPHPTRDRDGHGLAPSPNVSPMDPDAWRDSPTYLHAIALFNRGYYWEAHEAWETLWIAAGRTGVMGDFFNGLIKLAAAGVKVRQGLGSRAAALGAAAAQRFQRADEASKRDRIGGLCLRDLVAFAEHIRDRGTKLVGSPEAAVEVVFDLRLTPA